MTRRAEGARVRRRLSLAHAAGAKPQSPRLRFRPRSVCFREGVAGIWPPPGTEGRYLVSAAPKTRTVRIILVEDDPFYAAGRTSRVVHEFDTARQFERGERVTFPSGRGAIVTSVYPDKRGRVRVITHWA